MRRSVGAAGVVILTLGCAQTSAEQQIVNEAAEALGGRERVSAVRTIAVEGEGTQYNLGQDLRPDARGQTFSVTGLTRRMDLTAGRVRTELTRTPNFAYFQGQAAQRQVQGIDAEVGYNLGANGTAIRVAAPTARDRRADFYHQPLTIVRAALAPGVTLANARTQSDDRLVNVTTDNGLTFVLAVDGAGLPSRVSSKSYHANLGDVTLSTQFAEYEEVSGIKLPTRVTTAVDDFTTAELRITKHTVDGDVGDLVAPDSAASAAASGPPPPNVVPEVVAPGIWLLAGQSHHSALIEMSVSENPHSHTMLMVHLPAERVLVEVDAFSPGAAVQPYAANLLENITKRRLRVDRIVPLHGAIAPFSDVVKAQASQTN